MHSALTQIMLEFKNGFIKGLRGTWKYGYFAPLKAAGFAITRPGSYLWHLRALYRLCYWRGDQLGCQTAARPTFER